MTEPQLEAGLGITFGRLSLAVIATLVIQFSAVIWFLAQLESRVAVNDEFRRSNERLNAQIAGLEERFDAVFRDLDRIEGRLIRFEQHFSEPRPTGAR